MDTVPLTMSLTEHSKFSRQLLQQHVQEATLFVQQCKRENKQVLDVCGDRGDLYFLLLGLGFSA
jgi:hypothetical protein